LSPVLARRLELYIAKKGLQDAGLLADFMTNIVEASLEEKLQVLAALDVKERLEKAVALLQRQIGNIKNNVSITTFTSSSIPTNLDLDQMNKINNQRARRAAMSALPPGMPGMGGPQDDEQEPLAYHRRLQKSPIESSKG
jgi:ATP-dependent Lon protease